MQELSPIASYAQRMLLRIEGRSALLRYGFALTIVATALAITLIFEEFFQTSPYLLFWAAVSLSAWYSGLGPSLVAALLSSISVSFFFLPPTFSIYASLDDILRLLISITIAVLMSSLYEARHRAARRLIQIQDITAALSEAVSSEDVANVILGYNAGLDDVEEIAIVILCEDEYAVKVWTSPGIDPVLREQYKRALNNHRVPISHSLKYRQSHWREKISHPNVQFTGLHPPQLQGVASVPMIVKGRLIGGIDFYFNERIQFDTESKLFLGVLIQEYAQAFSRSRLYESEARARQAAERANQLKLQFLGMVSHELRSPLATIKGFASTMIDPDVVFSPAEQQQFARIIDCEADRLGEMIEQLLDVSQIRAGVFSVRPEPRALQGVLVTAMPQLRTLTGEHHLSLSIPDDLPQVMIDERRIVQVLVNLTGNAARYSPTGTCIHIEAVEEEGHVRIDISDEGPGIPADQRERVFEVFEQSEQGLRVGRGAGLGLAISQGIVEAHGGRIWIQDQVKRGTTVSFTIDMC